MEQCCFSVYQRESSPRDLVSYYLLSSAVSRLFLVPLSFSSSSIVTSSFFRIVILLHFRLNLSEWCQFTEDYFSRRMDVCTYNRLGNQDVFTKYLRKRSLYVSIFIFIYIYGIILLIVTITTVKK